jgi:hypothetical protein
VAVVVIKYFYWLMLLVAAAAGWIAFGAFRRARSDRRAELARRQFEGARSAHQADFFAAAAATGKPRGLVWKRCDLDDALVLARDRANGELVGLVAVTISFEALAGGGMEEVEAVGNLRAATAVFTHNGRQWTTQGRAVFNLEPREVLDRYRDSLDPLTT